MDASSSRSASASLKDLPVEVLRSVLSQLDPPDKLAFAGTCKRLRSACVDGGADLVRRDLKYWASLARLAVLKNEDEEHQLGKHSFSSKWDTLAQLVRYYACPYCRRMPPRDEYRRQAQPSLQQARYLEEHPLLNDVVACRTCQRSHPSLKLVTLNTALEQYGIDIDLLGLVLGAVSATDDPMEHDAQDGKMKNDEVWTTVRSMTMNNPHRHKRDHPNAPRRVRLFLLRDLLALKEAQDKHDQQQE